MAQIGKELEQITIPLSQPHVALAVSTTLNSIHTNQRITKIATADMKTISVTVDDDTHRRLRTMAVEQGTSVSALVREHMLRVLNGSDRGRLRKKPSPKGAAAGWTNFRKSYCGKASSFQRLRG